MPIVLSGEQYSVPDSVVLILNFNGEHTTVQCLEFLSFESDPEWSIIVVDNGSTDNSISAIEASFPSVPILLTGANLGYAGGNNFGLRWCVNHGAKRVLILNNDVRISWKAITRLGSLMKSDMSIGIGGPAILKGSTGYVESAGMRVFWSRGYSTAINSGRRYEDLCRCMTDVDCVTGSAFLVSKETIEKIGYLPRHFFLYGEELDLCARALEAGYRVVCDSSVYAEHDDGVTTSRYPGLKAYYMSRNWILLMKRHGSFGGFLRHTMIVVPTRIAALAAGLPGDWVDLVSSAKGILAGLVRASHETPVC